MSQPRRQRRDHTTPSESTPPRRHALEAAEGGGRPGSSPARLLQHAVEDSLEPQAPEPSGRWAPRTTLLFSGGVALVLWAAIIGGVVAAVRLLGR